MTEKDSNWKTIQERGSLLGLRIVVWCYRLFGRPLAVALTHTIVTYFFLTDRPGRAASRDYLCRVQAEAPQNRQPSNPPNLWSVFLHYRAFALSILDRLIFWLGDADDFEFDIEGTDILRSLRAEKRGAIFIGAHMGSFDALRMIAVEDRVRVNVVMYTQHTPRINSILKELSPDADLQVIHYDPRSFGSVFAIRACIERGEIVAILGDRYDPGERTCHVPFLGANAHFPQSPFLLAQRLGCPLVLMLGLRSSGKRYRVITEVLSPEGTPERTIDREKTCRQVAHYAARLGHYCIEAPHQWFNFFDFWRDTPPDPRRN